MHTIPWYIVLVQSIPEAMLLMMIGFHLFRLDINIRTILIIATINSVLVYYFRYLEYFFIHTVLGLLTLIILTVILTKKNPWKIFISILTGITIIAVLQSITLPICFNMTETTPEDLTTNPWLNFFFTIPQMLIMIILYAYLRYSNYNFEYITKEEYDG
ncbi:hypothetical protein SYNTR_2292 [Candidatus Syntrophocurvum alkaliphilum]|uniref:Uncharacterized protein n=1 Tax=Candidatus Syntrophocurvum alkaliphilum TaxID=2293317 RepID=A0A6I6DFU6_9FIRM|nr:hypothetical protein [Candidatus Syntrophocurvum alkaliphilum]QGU00886.1 hypothetical protein SYNTR_2292 [Candidatus Syntrophocurvum alkaliphilum]